MIILISRNGVWTKSHPPEYKMLNKEAELAKDEDIGSQGYCQHGNERRDHGEIQECRQNHTKKLQDLQINPSCQRSLKRKASPVASSGNILRNSRYESG